jgi:hypothetical protein
MDDKFPYKAPAARSVACPFPCGHLPHLRVYSRDFLMLTIVHWLSETRSSRRWRKIMKRSYNLYLLYQLIFQLPMKLSFMDNFFVPLFGMFCNTRTREPFSSDVFINYRLMIKLDFTNNFPCNFSAVLLKR